MDIPLKVNLASMCYNIFTCHRVYVYIDLAVEASFYSDVGECLTVNPATWVRFPAGTGKIFLLYDNGSYRIEKIKFTFTHDDCYDVPGLGHHNNHHE